MYHGLETWDRNRHVCMLDMASQKRIFVSFIKNYL